MIEYMTDLKYKLSVGVDLELQVESVDVVGMQLVVRSKEGNEVLDHGEVYGDLAGVLESELRELRFVLLDLVQESLRIGSDRYAFHRRSLCPSRSQQAPQQGFFQVEYSHVQDVGFRLRQDESQLAIAGPAQHIVQIDQRNHQLQELLWVCPNEGCF